METIKCQNSYGNTVTFTDSFPYFLEKVSGIHTKSSELYSMKSAFGVGESYIGRSVNKRNILIYGYFKDNFDDRIQYLNNVFPDDDEGILYYHTDKTSAKISYRVEKIDIDEVGPIRYFTISLICFNPYFTDLEETRVTLSEWEGGLEFPLEIIDDEIEFETKNQSSLAEIINPTKVESGLKIIFNATGTVINPSIKNIINQELLTIDFEMKIGDVIQVTTYRNNNNIVLIRDGIETNINNYLLYGTRFLKLNPGTNNFKILADDGVENLTVEIYYLINYEVV